MSMKLKREEYGNIFGPTAGDRLHLGDTGLVLEVEKDFYENDYGNEVVAGGGKSIRDGMGQKPGITCEEGALDAAITNMIIVDPVLGVVKGDIGIKDGMIVGIGKAGNPDIMDITPGLVIGASTEIITGDCGMIVKVNAALDAARTLGRPVDIASWRHAEQLPALFNGMPMGTRILA